MADKTVSLELKIDASGAAQSIADLKKSIQDYKNKALSAGEDSVIGKQFLKAAGEAKDRLSDLNRQVDNFQDAGAKFGAVSKLVGGLAAGFQAAQGAAALFGSSGEDIQKIMLKVQSATALAQGVQGIAGLGESFKDVGAIIRGPLVAAFTTMRGAIIATGVGALVVAAGLLYQNFDKVKEVLKNVIPESVQKGFKFLYDTFVGITDKFKDLIGLGKEAQSKNPFGVLDQFTKKAAENKKALSELIAEQKKQEEYNKKLSESGNPGSIGYYNFLLSESTAQLNKLVPGTAAYNAELEKNIQLQKDLAAAQEATKRPEDTIQKLEGLPIQELAGANSPEGKAITLTQDFLTAQLKKGITERNKLQQQELDQQKAKRDAYIQISGSIISGLASLGNLAIKNADKQAKFQKKVAVAQLLVDTATGISNMIAAGTKVGVTPIEKAVAIAGGIALVLGNMAKAKSILSKAGDVSVPTLDAGGAVGAGGGATPGAPELTQPTTNIPQGQGTTIPDTKVYVTETDIKRVTNRVNVIESRATFR